MNRTLYFFLTYKIWKKNIGEIAIKRLRICFQTTRLSLLLSLIFFNNFSFSQIPKRANEIADSIIKTRIICANTSIELKDTIYYPKFKNQYQDRKTESYQFRYKVMISNNIVTELDFSIEENFSIKYIGGMPDNNYNFSPCEIMPIEKLWQIAKNKGLKTKFRKSFYYIKFEEDGILIDFLEQKSRYNIDEYTLNAITGKYIRHFQANITF